METLKNKIALVTGAGRGIGRAIALALAKEGVQVALLGRTEKSLQETAAQITNMGVKTAFATADVAEMSQVNKAVAKLTAELGPINILVNNAGIGKFGTFLELDPVEWEQIIRVNLMGVYYTTRAVLPAMIEAQTGDIINIGSTSGLRASAGSSAYSASKFALQGLTEALMYEVRKHNIRVMGLNPSTVATDLAFELSLTDGDPARVMQPEDLAELLISQLKLNRRVFVKSSAIWSTNP
ncbi:MAG TPA: 3-ketoacyl-ACP reductase [Daejeonella sp.]|nr:3-ketoacyl-ACP reductase [Daejeonella sp.]